MKLCSRRRIEQLIFNGDIHFGNQLPLFLDDVRVGMRLNDVVFEIASARLSDKVRPALRQRSIAATGMKRGDWVIGTSVEVIGLSGRVCGFVNTRSKFARYGLEMVGSSWFVAPGFGRQAPTSIVFEITAKTDLSGFDDTTSYAYILFFELEMPVELTEKNYGDRFPF